MRFTHQPFAIPAAGLVSLIFVIPSCKPSTENNRPNIILFLADDLGYGDLECYNPGGVRTPAINSLADQGVRFTSFYSNGPECTPTRTALITGRYQQRVGGLECAIGTYNVGRYDDAIRLRETNDLGLPVSETSIARVLKDEGYATAICGKWHLGYEDKFNPNLHGFDHAFYALGGGMDYFHHRELPPPSLHILYENGKPVEREGYFTDLIGEESVKFIESRSRNTPFFLYVPFTAPHAPYQGPDDYRPEILPDTSVLWNQSLGPRQVYEAMIKRMDEVIGLILKKIEEKGLSDNTLVIFMSDNGGTKSGSNSPLNGFKGNMFEGGIRVPCLARWPGKLPAGKVSGQACMSFDFSASIIRVAGATMPAGREPDGIDILKLIQEDKPVMERTLFWRSRRGADTRKAVRQGNLKYIWLSSGGKINEYLFDLESDLSERTDLLDSRPDDANRLRALLDKWEKEVKPVR